MVEIGLQAFWLQPEGEIDCNFIGGDEIHALRLQYKLFDGLCLAWVVK